MIIFSNCNYGSTLTNRHGNYLVLELIQTEMCPKYNTQSDYEITKKECMITNNFILIDYE